MVAKETKIYSTVLSAILAMSVLILSFLGWQYFDFQRKNQALNLRYSRFLDLQGRLMLFDEILTMSTRIAATGETAYEERYQKFEPQLDSAIRDVLSLFPEWDVSREIEKTEAANQRLVEMEHKAFELSRGRNFAEARGLLDSPFYQKQKQEYQQGMEDAFRLLRLRVTAELQKHERYVLFLMIALCAGIALILFLWGVTLRELRRRLAVEQRLKSYQVSLEDEIASRTQELMKANKALHNLTAQLETRVKERTRELAETNASLKNEISVRTGMEAMLRESRQYVQEIISTITDYFYTVTVRSGKVVGVVHQPSCLAVTGYSSQEFLDRPTLWFDMVASEDRQRVLEHAEAILVGQKPIPALEHRIIRKDGVIRWVRNVSVLHHDGEGKLVSYDGIISDVTEKKRAEELLMEAMKCTQEAYEVKSQFLANMSHEIRTPLYAIIGFSELLEKTVLGREQKDYVAMVRESSRLLLALVTDILDFSKAEAKEVKLESISFDFANLIQGVVKLQEVNLSKENIRLFCTIHPMPNRFRGDPTRIMQILMNLVNNAVKFTEQGEIEITARMQDDRSKDSGSRIRTVFVSVRDTGIGIPLEKQPRIFEAFEQADISTTRKYGGTGLGLTIAKGLVGMMGGEIGLRSEPGHGSTFFFTLKLEEAAEEKEKTRQASPETVRPETRVLIVDDDLSTQKLLTIMLGGLGCQTDVASNGQSAIHKLKTESWDVVLMDLQMPLMGGLETVRLIRDKLHSTVPVIGLSASVFESDRKECLAEGMDDYLTKPLEMDRLKEKIIQWGSSRNRQDPAAAKAEALKALAVPEEMYDEMVRDFIDQTHRSIGDLSVAVTAQDFKKIAEIAHGIKGSSGNLRIRDVFEAAKSMELSARQGDGIGKIQTSFLRLKDALQLYQNE